MSKMMRGKKRTFKHYTFMNGYGRIILKRRQNKTSMMKTISLKPRKEHVKCL
jgi:hypothetical protein